MARHHLDRVANCARKLDETRSDRDEAIYDAWKSGETYRDIAKVAGVNYQRVGQIVKAKREQAAEE